MNKCYQRYKIYRKILKIKDNKKYKNNKHIKEIKSKCETGRNNSIKNYLNEKKRKFIYQDNIEKKIIIQNKNSLLNIINFQLEHYFFILIILSIKLIFLLCQYAQQNILFKLSNVSLKIKAREQFSILS